ncbi:MAG: hypothetical protein NT178_09500 [Proteobacteria bacterium]|nr:hypothetical protein [Pseudomonadota bacterium]
MKKIFVYIAASILLYGFFRELNVVKVLMICLGLGTAYLIYLIPARHIAAMKYPFICFALAVTAFFFVYPKINIQYPFDALIVFVSFYGLTFYLITIEEKGKSLFKEIAALSILFLSSAFNLFMIGKPLFIIPMSIAAVLFLFVIGKNRLIPFIAAYTVVIIIALLLFNKGVSMLGDGVKINDVEKYLLLAASFGFLVTGFIGFVKKSNFIKLIVFFGFLYIATDIFMVLGLRLSTGLLYQPVTALLILTPLIGIMLKAEKERI